MLDLWLRGAELSICPCDLIRGSVSGWPFTRAALERVLEPSLGWQWAGQKKAQNHGIWKAFIPLDKQREDFCCLCVLRKAVSKRQEWEGHQWVPGRGGCVESWGCGQGPGWGSWQEQRRAPLCFPLCLSPRGLHVDAWGVPVAGFALTEEFLTAG